MPQTDAQASVNAAPTWLFVLPWSTDAVGGVTQVVLNLAQQMRASGSFRPVLLQLDWDAVKPVWQGERDLPTVRWRVRPPGLSLRDRLAHRVWEHGFTRDFEAFCREHKVAVVNPHYVGAPSLSLQGAASKLRRPLPVLFSFHGADLSAIEASPAQTKAWRLALQTPRAAAVACSSALGQRIDNLLDSAARVVHNGVDMEALLRNSMPPAPRARRTILSVGKYEAKKGQSTLLRAFALIQRRFPDVDLQFIGARDQELPALQSLTESLQIGERVRFAVDVAHAEVANFLAQADVFALPSRQEPFGLVILEAAAFRLPVIASRVGGIPEIIREGETGLLIEPGEPQPLADGLATLLAEPDAAAAMGLRLHDDTRQRFSWKKTAERYEAILRSLG